MPDSLIEQVKQLAAYDGYPLAQVTLIQRDAIMFAPLLAHMQAQQAVVDAAKKCRCLRIWMNFDPVGTAHFLPEIVEELEAALAALEKVKP